MKINRIYLGTWLPRTRIHLREIYDFLKNCSGTDLNEGQLRNYHQQLNIEKIEYQNNPDFDSLEFTSGRITVAITEDGIIQLMVDKIEDMEADLKEFEEFNSKKLAPALAYIFSRGAPLPQTLINISEFYPKIIVGTDIKPEEAEKILNNHNSSLLATNEDGGTRIFWGKDIEIIDIVKSDLDFNTFLTNAILIDSSSDLLRRYLVAHRNIWADIDSIRESGDVRYGDFPIIRNKILESLKNVSFIRTRLQQMLGIISARKMILSPAVEQKLIKLGFEDFKVLESSNNYFNDLYKMTEDYAQGTLTLFETLVSENTQREVRLLQQITVLGAIVGFFGMNIAFPWEERWPNIFLSSFVVIGAIVLAMSIFYFAIKKFILNRRFNLIGTINRK